VLLIGHVMEGDGAGHGGRFAQDLQDMKDKGLVGIEVVVMRGFDEDNPNQLPPIDKLKEDAGDGVKVSEVKRRPGAKPYAHLVVTKDGVTVYTGEMNGEDRPAHHDTQAFEGGAPEAAAPSSAAVKTDVRMVEAALATLGEEKLERIQERGMRVQIAERGGTRYDHATGTVYIDPTDPRDLADVIPVDLPPLGEGEREGMPVD
jgi:hypothetical protein